MLTKQVAWAAVLVVLFSGCNQLKPSYADLLAVYEAEQAELDRIIEKQKTDPAVLALQREHLDRVSPLDAEKRAAQERGASQEEIASIEAKVSESLKRFLAEAEATQIGSEVVKQRKRVEAARAAKDAAAPK